MVKAGSWWQRWQGALQRESAFLPKRLVLVTLLILVLYLGMLVRTGWKVQHTALGFVEANLQSELVADYERAEEPSARFAPLRLEILRTKLQDENPNWSAAEVEAALQAALAAALAPIQQATPTPYPTTRMIVRADGVVHEQWVALAPTVSNLIARPGEQRRTAVASQATAAVLGVRLPPSLVGGTLTPAVTLASPNKPASQPEGEQTATLPAMPLAGTPLPPMTPTPVAMTRPIADSVPLPAPITLSNPASSSPPSPIISSTATTIPGTHLAASQPSANESATPLPSPTTMTLWITPMTTISPATPTASQEALPSLPTITATATPLVIAPTTAPTTAPTASMTPLPSPTATSSPTVTPTPVTSTPTPPLLPTVDGLTAMVEDNQIKLQWATPTSKAWGYHLYRSETMAAAPDQRLNATPLIEATYIDRVAPDGKQYRYFVTALDQQNRESPPSQAILVTVADHTPPRVPSLLSLHLSNNQIQIHWQANTETDLAGYRLYRSTSWPVDRSLGPIHGATLLTTTTYIDQLLLNGQTYHYVFTAVDQAGNESRPSIDAQMPTIDLTAPAPPAGLMATVQAAGIELTWQANGESDLTGYRLYRSPTLPVDRTALPVHTQPLLTTPSYRDETVAAGASYYYVVVAVDGSQNSSSASEAVAATVE
ncbi:MAG: hypothetical protein ACOYNY_26940 [Caldilineaceae bacterium]